MKKIKVIGVGGIGTCLLFLLSRHLGNREDCQLVLIDGDDFEPQNALRQDFEELGNKAKVKAKELANKFPNLSIRNIREFITKDNIEDIIEEGDWIIVCVDNHTTRKLISDHCCTLNDITLISAGNDLTDGNCQVYIKQAGENITRPITDLHPEINNPKDISPGEMSCQERANQPGSRQILIANAMAALLIYNNFWLLEDGKIDQVGEDYFDLLTPTKVQTHERKPPMM